MSGTRLAKVDDVARRDAVASAHGDVAEAVRLLRRAQAALGGFAPLPCSAFAFAGLSQAAVTVAAVADDLAR